jgi:hypothetical protein
MPVLSETTFLRHGAACSHTLYLAVGCVVVLIGVVMLKRRLSSSKTSTQKALSAASSPPPTYSEKGNLLNEHPPMIHSHTHAPPPAPLSPHALPFTRPTLLTTSYSMGEGGEKDLPLNEYYDSPTEMNVSSFDSFEPLRMAGDAGDDAEMPRRRSYTRTSSNGSSLSGEILQVSPISLASRIETAGF